MPLVAGTERSIEEVTPIIQKLARSVLEWPGTKRRHK
jgi:hypothetical protein